MKTETMMKSVAAKAVKSMMNADTYGWPPYCAGFFHQPQRPACKSETMQKKEQKV